MCSKGNRTGCHVVSDSLKWKKHDDVIKWNIFRITGHLCREFTGHRWIPSTKASDVELWYFFICVWINSWVSNREADDLRRYRAHYDVIVMGSDLDSPKASINTLMAKKCIYVSVDKTIISSDNGLAPNRRQAIIWTNDDIMPIRRRNTF